MTPHSTTPPTIQGHVNVCRSVDPKFLIDLLGEELPNPRKEKTQVQRMWFKNGRQVAGQHGMRLGFVYDGINMPSIGIMVRLRWRVKTRHKFRIKRMKSCKRMTEYETRKMWNRCFLGRYEKTYLQQLRPSYLTF
jgi:hypothetical protein